MRADHSVAAGLHRLLPLPDHRTWHSCGKTGKSLEICGICFLSSIPSLGCHGRLVHTAPQASFISLAWATVAIC